ncbi:MotA/TolQ/ExbB proton channel family protein [Alphaproteobacteria bacterium]|nr:MotA/TolQ/ExbB proton channel family protein [Alphaproteobacteria bacterium]
MEFFDIVWLFLNPFEAIRGVRDFLELGGNVLVIIMFTTVVLWALIYERYSFFRSDFKLLEQRRLAEWKARSEHRSWNARRIREMIISDAKQKAVANLTYIKVLVALAPFLGLLGTVTGMIEVFDVMAITGSGNARAMAAGISKATLPTMAGMVVALSGLFFTASLERKAEWSVEQLEDRLELAD